MVYATGFRQGDQAMLRAKHLIHPRFSRKESTAGAPSFSGPAPVQDDMVDSAYVSAALTARPAGPAPTTAQSITGWPVMITSC